MAAGDIPESVYRNTLDLNRFSTGTARKLVKHYDQIINDAIDQLAVIERMPRAKQPKYKADRLRSLIKQLQKSLNGWSHKSAAQMVKELDGIARLQGEFAQLQLEKALPAGTSSVVNPLNITKGYAESVVNSNPIDLNASLLSDDLQAKVKGLPEKFSLTSKQGTLVNLPNGQSLKQSFRGLAAKQAELFGRTVRDGMLTGEPTPQLARRLRDQLIFEDGKPFKPNQVTNLVRTSVQQVSNDAAQAVYANNQDITKEYRWVATLDSKTAPECQILDQQKFKYGQGPQPPQHFGCRCRTVAVIDYGDDYQPKIGKRASEFGSVPRGTSYGKFLKDQSASYKAKVLGKNKVKYFNTLSKKYGPDQALRKMVRTDGQSKTLKQLQKTYGKTPTTSKKLKPTPPKPKTTDLDPDVLLKKAQRDSNAYLGGGAFGNAYSVDGDPPLVIKKGQIGRHEVEAMEKLKGTGVAPQVKAQKYTTGWTKDHEFGISSLELREGTVVMTRAKGKPVADFLDDKKKFGTLSKPKNLKQRDDMINEYIKTRKILHKKGVSHNDMHDGNFFFDVKTNKGSVVDLGLAKINPRAALIEALGPGTGGDDQAQRMFQLLKGDRGSAPTPALLKKLEDNIFHVQNELDKRGLGTLATEILGWDTYTNPKALVHPDLTDKLSVELIDMVYDGI